MEPVVRGLPDLSQCMAAREEGTQMVAPPPDPPPIADSKEAPSPPAIATPEHGPGASTIWLVTILSFLCGGLAIALAVVLTRVEVHRRELTNPTPSPLAGPLGHAPAPPVAPVAPIPGRVVLPSPSTETAGPSPAAGTSREELAVARAVMAVQRLYTAFNSGDQDGALQWMEGSAVRQLNPAYFRQFTAVGVGELRPTSIMGSTVNLDGVVTLVNSDFSQLKENRSFTVDISRDPPRVSASAVGKAMNRR